MCDMKGMDMAKKPAAGAQAAREASGTIKKIDVKTSSVVISHGPVASLKWPPMTMGFKIRPCLPSLRSTRRLTLGLSKKVTTT